MLLDLFTVKGVNTKSTCIESTKSFYIKSACANNICTRGTCIKNTFSAIDAYIKGAGLNNTSTKGTNRKSAYVRDTCIIKNSRIHL